jgi:alpha-galactosidase
MQNMAATPPMGWNSWDCYGATVTEDEVLGNAEYMAEQLKPFGWKHVVVDIHWYEPHAQSSAYRPFVPLEMDAYPRLIPATNRFPSAGAGQGFKPLADRIHSLGLMFGIHIMRGIPRQAVHQNTPILGTSRTAREIAHPNSICPWNTDIYGVEPVKDGAQHYCASLFQLYASWAVDFVKVDDMSRPYAIGEIEFVRNALDRCGRAVVLSLSPGPTPVEMAEHVKTHASMWRMTDDFWDKWEHLYGEFERCHQWSPHVGPGHWPDADMLPLGHVAIRSVEHGRGDRWTLLTREEQVTMLTLWCICRSPLMVGAELRDNDEWTLSLLTTQEVLRILNHSHSNRQLYRYGPHIAWTAVDEDGSTYLAVFNTGTREAPIETGLWKLGLNGKVNVRDLWVHEDVGELARSIVALVPPHGARLFKLTSVA